MPKLAIYVPKEEMRQIEKWRKRINFSQVFMRALAVEIRERSRGARASGDQVAAAADFYKRKLAANCQPLEDAAFQLGSKHVLDCRLSPEQILRINGLADAESLSKDDVAELEGAIGDDKKNIDAAFKKLDLDEQSFPAWRQVAHRGYAKGVAAAWKQVCERMR